ncbi:MAG: hypothetical protein CVU54_14440 [Deltaproteobacteria bacterium HGW-Deltaproteobacteria-12]|nr:MAG: hypothetical protein CVU54_14440 [Deltaproteobacteria bacterium HGW-Deltaproteobacteria-12]
MEEKPQPQPQQSNVADEQPKSSLTKALSPESIVYSKAASFEDAHQLSSYYEKIKNKAMFAVAMIDIRESTTFMLHLEQFESYALTLADFIYFIRKTVISSGGFFDKFTGDGALIFWDVDNFNPSIIKKVVYELVKIQQCFIGEIIPLFRQYAGCMPTKYGLSIGLDCGICLLTDLKSDKSNASYGYPQLNNSINSVTVLGRPVVGAARMVAQAQQHQILINEYIGEYLLRNPNELNEGDCVLRVEIKNKDLRGNQFAYLLCNKEIRGAIGG